jgi:hypothetical protein
VKPNPLLERLKEYKNIDQFNLTSSPVVSLHYEKIVWQTETVESDHDMKINSAYLKPKIGHFMLDGSVVDSELHITQDGEYAFREGATRDAGYWRVLRIPGTNVR